MSASADEILRLLAGADEISTARAAKQLGLAQSQLFRQLATLTPGLIEVDRGDTRTLLRLTAAGRAQLAQSK